MASDSPRELGTFEEYMKYASPDMDDIHFEMQRLPPVHRRAFAGNCAERWYPAYRALIDELALTEELRPLLDAFWGHLLGRTLSPRAADELVRMCTDLCFGEEDDSDYFWDAVGAVGAAWCALKSCHGDTVEFAVRASATITDRVFQIAETEGWPELGILAPGEISRHICDVKRHPLMIEERARQRDVLFFLRQHRELTPADIRGVQHLGVTTEGPWQVCVEIARTSKANRQRMHEER